MSYVRFEAGPLRGPGNQRCRGCHAHSVGPPAVEIRLRWLFGEWRFSPEAGVPYFDRIMVKKPDIEGIKQIIRTEIMAVDGMTDLKNLEISIDAKSRVAAITFEAPPTAKSSTRRCW